jgi:hypothetical protein
VTLHAVTAVVLGRPRGEPVHHHRVAPICRARTWTNEFLSHSENQPVLPRATPAPAPAPAPARPRPAPASTPPLRRLPRAQPNPVPAGCPTRTSPLLYAFHVDLSRVAPKMRRPLTPPLIAVAFDARGLLRHIMTRSGGWLPIYRLEELRTQSSGRRES